MRFLKGAFSALTPAVPIAKSGAETRQIYVLGHPPILKLHKRMETCRRPRQFNGAASSTVRISAPFVL